MAEVDRSIPFIDTHHHLWELDRFHYDWLTDPGWEGHNALLGDYKMIRSTIGAPWRLFKEFYGANVIKSVHVEAAYAGPDALEETVWLEQVANEFGMPNAIVAFCDIEAPKRKRIVPVAASSGLVAPTSSRRRRTASSRQRPTQITGPEAMYRTRDSKKGLPRCSA